MELVAGSNITLEEVGGQLIASATGGGGALPDYENWDITVEQNQQQSIDISNGRPILDINDEPLIFNVDVPAGAGTWTPNSAGSPYGALVITSLGLIAIPVTVTDGVNSVTYYLNATGVNTVPNIPDSGSLSETNKELAVILGPEVDQNGDSVIYTFVVNGTQVYTTATITATLTGNRLSYTRTDTGTEALVIRADDGLNTHDFTVTISTIAASSNAITRNFHSSKIGSRKFPTAITGEANEVFESAPVTIFNLEADYIDFTNVNQTGAEISINGGQWLTVGTDQVRAINGDVIQARATGQATRNQNDTWTFDILMGPNAASGGTKYMFWTFISTWRERGTARNWKLGTGALDGTQFSDIASQVEPGDDIEIITSQYHLNAFDWDQISGTEEYPIRIWSAFEGLDRPVIGAGGSTLFDEYGIVWRLRNSLYIHMENLIIDGENDAGTLKVFAYEAAFAKLKNVWIRRSNGGHGLQGWDSNSGDLDMEYCEVTQCGGAGSSLKHAIYGSSDYDKYPNSVYNLKLCSLHTNDNNTIKTRSQNLIVDRCWLENTLAPGSITEVYYLVQHIGPEEYYDDIFDPCETIVSGSIFMHKYKNYQLQVGSDGSGHGHNKLLFQNNLSVMTATTDEYSEYMKADTSYDIASWYMRNNIFTIEGGSRNSGNDYITLTRYNADASSWYYGDARIAGNNNLVLGDNNPSFRVRVDATYPEASTSPLVTEWTDSLASNWADAGLSIDKPNLAITLAPTPTDDILETAFQDLTTLPVGYDMPYTYDKFMALSNPNEITEVLPLTRPAEGTHLPDAMITRAAGGKMGPF